MYERRGYNLVRQEHSQPSFRRQCRGLRRVSCVHKLTFRDWILFQRYWGRAMALSYVSYAPGNVLAHAYTSLATAVLGTNGSSEAMPRSSAQRILPHIDRPLPAVVLLLLLHPKESIIPRSLNSSPECPQHPTVSSQWP